MVENLKYIEDPSDEWAEGPKMELVENPKYSVNNEELIREIEKPFIEQQKLVENPKYIEDPSEEWAIGPNKKVLPMEEQQKNNFRDIYIRDMLENFSEHKIIKENKNQGIKRKTKYITQQKHRVRMVTDRENDQIINEDVIEEFSKPVVEWDITPMSYLWKA